MKIMLNVVCASMVCGFSMLQAKAPKIPEYEMKDGQEFVDSSSGKQCVVVNSTLWRGVKVWDEDKLKYLYHGVVYHLNSDGTLNYIQTWENGVWEGLYQMYTRKGNLVEEGNYKLGKKNGIWKEYMLGKLHSVTTYENNMQNGEKLTYYPGKNKLMWREQFLNNRLHGVREVFHENGQKTGIESYKEGKLHGLSISKDSTGKVFDKRMFVNGVFQR